jgi:hypothetical protein
MDTDKSSSGMRRLTRSALAFVALGLLLYAVLFYAAEQLSQRTAHSNPFFKIAVAEERAVDWVVLGASHAMPLDFADMNGIIRRKTGLKIINLAAPGTGPLYNRFVFEHFLREHRTANVVYVVDAFAFYSRTWNEERFADAKLLARTPMETAIAASLWRAVRNDGVSARALLDYGSGFSKINNRDRFKIDSWEGESQFERTWRPSPSAVKKRIAYLYPDGTPPAVRDRYLGELSRLFELAQQAGARVVVVNLPMPTAYRSQLPDEARFDQALLAMLARSDIAYRDFSAALPEPRFYFDSDHLNRIGVTEFLERHLSQLLLEGAANGGAT